MNKDLQIDGMHCQACVNLISLELEDVGLKEKIKEVKLLDGQNQGVVTLAEITEDDLAKATSAINNLGQYRVTNNH